MTVLPPPDINTLRACRRT